MNQGIIYNRNGMDIVHCEYTDKVEMMAHVHESKRVMAAGQSSKGPGIEINACVGQASLQN